MCDDSERTACGLGWDAQRLCLSYLEAGARDLGGRMLQRAFALAYPEATGRQSPWQPGSHPGSSPQGS